MLTEQQFIREFEQTNLDPCHFDHLGHVRISWLYLKQYQTELAIEKIATGIQRYATSLGAPNKFHMTMTVTLAKVIASRIRQDSNLSWDEFVIANQDLISDAKKLVSEYYSEALIESTAARSQYLEPDKRGSNND